MKSIGVWKVLIKDVDFEKEIVWASWNNNPVKKFYKNTWSKWRLKEPKLIYGAFGRARLAKRGE